MTESPPRRRGPEPTLPDRGQLTVALSGEQLAWVEATAARRRCSKADVVRRLIKRAMPKEAR